MRRADKIFGVGRLDGACGFSWGDEVCFVVMRTRLLCMRRNLCSWRIRGGTVLSPAMEVDGFAAHVVHVYKTSAH